MIIQIRIWTLDWKEFACKLNEYDWQIKMIKKNLSRWLKKIYETSFLQSYLMIYFSIIHFRFKELMTFLQIIIILRSCLVLPQHQLIFWIITKQRNLFLVGKLWTPFQTEMRSYFLELESLVYIFYTIKIFQCMSKKIY